MKKIIEIHNLNFQYSRQAKLLSDLTLELENGKIHGLLGKNGEGKTTLLKLISGLLFPLSGEINVIGYTPAKRQPEMLQDIFYLPEELYDSSLSIDLYEKVYAPFYPNFSSSTFHKYMNELLLDSKVHNIDELSYGQKKKFYIAFGLATKAKLILMDEPTNALDIPSKRLFRKMVTSAIDENSCMLISTHQVLDLEDILDKIIIMDNHQIIFNESTEDITKKLIFRNSTKDEKNKSVIYSEESTEGYKLVCENKTGESGKLDIELLFNAIMSEKDRILQSLSE